MLVVDLTLLLGLLVSFVTDLVILINDLKEEKGISYLSSNVIVVASLKGKYGLGPHLTMGYLHVIQLESHLVHLFLGDDALIDKLLRVEVEHVLVLLDDGVHDRLGEHRLVDLVVAVLTVAHQIYDHIL